MIRNDGIYSDTASMEGVLRAVVCSYHMEQKGLAGAFSEPRKKTLKKL